MKFAELRVERHAGFSFRYPCITKLRMDKSRGSKVDEISSLPARYLIQGHVCEVLDYLYTVERKASHIYLGRRTPC